MQLSFIVGSPKTITQESELISAGGVIAGADKSTIVTDWTKVVWFPVSSENI